MNWTEFEQQEEILLFKSPGPRILPVIIITEELKNTESALNTLEYTLLSLESV